MRQRVPVPKARAAVWQVSGELTAVSQSGKTTSGTFSGAASTGGTSAAGAGG